MVLLFIIDPNWRKQNYIQQKNKYIPVYSYNEKWKRTLATYNMNECGRHKVRKISQAQGAHTHTHTYMCMLRWSLYKIQILIYRMKIKTLYDLPYIGNLKIAKCLETK